MHAPFTPDQETAGSYSYDAPANPTPTVREDDSQGYEFATPYADRNPQALYEVIPSDFRSEPVNLVPYFLAAHVW